MSMFNVRMTWTTMELLLLVSLCLLTGPGTTSADGNGPAVIKMVVKEDDDAILPCSLGTSSIKQEVFDWKKDGKKEVFMYERGRHYNNGKGGQDKDFIGRVKFFSEHLEFGNASIVIIKTKVTDSGSYTCDFPYHQPMTRAHITLLVGAAPEPSIRTFSQTKDGVPLQCFVRGAFPKPHVQLEDRAGNIITAEEPQVTEREDRKFDVILNVTVTKTDDYRCVVTQKELNHQIYAETNVPVHGAASESQTGWIVAAVFVTLFVCVVGAVVVLVKKGCITLNSNTGSSHSKTNVPTKATDGSEQELNKDP